MMLRFSFPSLMSPLGVVSLEFSARVSLGCVFLHVWVRGLLKPEVCKSMFKFKAQIIFFTHSPGVQGKGEFWAGSQTGGS